MNLKFGDRVAGKDGTHRKITALRGDTVFYMIGLMGERDSCGRQEFEDWAVEPFDYEAALADAQLGQETDNA